MEMYFLENSENSVLMKKRFLGYSIEIKTMLWYLKG